MKSIIAFPKPFISKSKICQGSLKFSASPNLQHCVSNWIEIPKLIEKQYCMRSKIYDFNKMAHLLWSCQWDRAGIPIPIQFFDKFQHSWNKSSGKWINLILLLWITNFTIVIVDSSFYLDLAVRVHTLFLLSVISSSVIWTVR